jgi:hypothetical protein
MAVEIIVEDGTCVAGANSYATIAQTRSYAESRGKAFPPDTDEGNAAAAVLLLTAMDAIEINEADFQGCKTLRDQSTAFPRAGSRVIDSLTGIEVGGFIYGPNEIPPQVPKAQMILAIEAQTTSLIVTTAGGQKLKKMKVEGAVEMEYADDGGGDDQPTIPLAAALLAPLMGDGDEPTFGGFRTDRV